MLLDTSELISAVVAQVTPDAIEMVTRTASDHGLALTISVIAIISGLSMFAFIARWLRDAIKENDTRAMSTKAELKTEIETLKREVKELRNGQRQALETQLRENMVSNQQMAESNRQMAAALLQLTAAVHTAPCGRAITDLITTEDVK